MVGKCTKLPQVACLGIFLTFFFLVSHAQTFNFDFQGDGGTPITGGGFAGDTTCNRDGFGPCFTEGFASAYGYKTYGITCWWMCGGNNVTGTPEMTPLLLEELTIDGVKYLHTIVGDPASGFAQETYIRGSTSTGSDSLTTSTWAAVFASGANNDPTVGTGPLQGPGNGSANPNKVVVRQIIGGTWNSSTKSWTCGSAEFCDEFLKANLDTKPKITQNINLSNLETNFVLDMSAITYQDASTAGTMVNTVSVIDSGFVKAEDGYFDVAQTPSYASSDNTGKNVHLTAGRYTYTESADTVIYGAGGTYTYYEDSVDVSAIDWCSYYDGTQNDTAFLICK